MIDDTKLAEWQKLCDAATKEPWKAYEYVRGDKWEIFGGDRGKQLVSHGSHQYDLETGHCILRADNANFIAAARTALPEAIAEIRRLRRIEEALVSIAARLVRGSDLVDLMELAEQTSDRVSRRQLDRFVDDAAERLKVVGIELKKLADQVKP